MATRPPTVAFGAITLLEVHDVAAAFGISITAAGLLAKSLDVPVVCVGRGRYIAQHALEQALYLVAKFGGTGFRAPGSRAKRTGRHTDSPIKISFADYTPNERKRAIFELERLSRLRSTSRAKTLGNLMRSVAKAPPPDPIAPEPDAAPDEPLPAYVDPLEGT